MAALSLLSALIIIHNVASGYCVLAYFSFSVYNLINEMLLLKHKPDKQCLHVRTCV